MNAASSPVPQLVAPAGSLRALQLAIDAGADAVYLGLRDATNARNFGGLNFDVDQVREGLRYAHERGAEVLMALNTYPRADDAGPWRRAVDLADRLGMDALILADIGLLGYAARSHPERALHLSVQASATTVQALEYYRRRYRIRRAVLPRVLTLQQVRRLCESTEVEVEVFGFGSLCVMVEGRCALSSWVTGRSPNTHGVCSPAESVRWQERGDHVLARLEDLLIDDYGADEPRGYPTVCKGRFMIDGARDYALEEPTSLNTLALLPGLLQAGARAIKIEGRQRSPAYVADVTRVWREALDLACSGQRYHVMPAWQQRLAPWTEGSQTTLGAFDRPWR